MRLQSHMPHFTHSLPTLVSLRSFILYVLSHMVILTAKLLLALDSTVILRSESHGLMVISYCLTALGALKALNPSP
jgi:hypothetical protein